MTVRLPILAMYVTGRLDVALFSHLAATVLKLDNEIVRKGDTVRINKLEFSIG